MLDFKSHLTNNFLIEAKVDEFVNRYMKGWEDHPLVQAHPEEARRRIAAAHGIGNSHHQNVYLTGELLNGVYRPEEDAPVMRQMVGLHDKAVKFGHAKKEDIADHTHDTLTRFYDDLEQKDDRFDDSEPPKPGNPRLPGLDKYHIGTITPHPKSEKKRINLKDPIHVYHFHDDTVGSDTEYKRIANIIGRNCPRNANICVRNSGEHLKHYSRGHGFLMYVQGGRVLRAHGYEDRGLVDHKNGMIIQKSPPEHEHLVSETLKLLPPDKKLMYGLHMAGRSVVKENGYTRDATQEEKKARVNQAFGNMKPLEVINLYKKEARRYKRDLQKRKTRDVVYPANEEAHHVADEYSRKKSDLLTHINYLIYNHLTKSGNATDISGTALADPKVIKHIAMNQVRGGQPHFVQHGKAYDPNIEASYVHSEHFDADDFSKLIKKNKDSIRKESETRKVKRSELDRLSPTVQYKVAQAMGFRGERLFDTDPAGYKKQGGYYHNDSYSLQGGNGLDTLHHAVDVAHRKGFVTQKHVDDIFNLGDQAKHIQSAFVAYKSPYLRPKHMDSMLSDLLHGDSSRYYSSSRDTSPRYVNSGLFFQHPLHTREHVERVMQEVQKNTAATSENDILRNRRNYDKATLVLAGAIEHSPHLSHDELSHYINHPDRNIPAEERGKEIGNPVQGYKLGYRHPTVTMELNEAKFNVAQTNAQHAILNPNATHEHITQHLLHPSSNHNAVWDLLQKTHPNYRVPHNDIFTPEHEHLILDILEGKRNAATNPRWVDSGSHKGTLPFYVHMKDPAALHRVISGKTTGNMFGHLLRYNPHLTNEHLDAMNSAVMGGIMGKKDVSGELDTSGTLMAKIDHRRKLGKPLYKLEDPQPQEMTTSEPRPRVGAYGTPEYRMRRPRRLGEEFETGIVSSFIDFLKEHYLTEAKIDQFVNRYMNYHDDHPMVKEDPEKARSLIAAAHGIGDTHAENVYLTDQLLRGAYKPNEDEETMRAHVGMVRKAVKKGHMEHEDILDHSPASLGMFFNDLEKKDPDFEIVEKPIKGNPPIANLERYKIGTVMPHPETTTRRIDKKLPIHVYHITHDDVGTSGRNPAFEFNRISKNIRQNCPKDSTICVRASGEHVKHYSAGHGLFLYVQGGRVVRAHGYKDQGIVTHKNYPIPEDEKQHLMDATSKLLTGSKKMTYDLHTSIPPEAYADFEADGDFDAGERPDVHDPGPIKKARENIQKKFAGVTPLQLKAVFSGEFKKYKKERQRGTSNPVYFPDRLAWNAPQRAEFTRKKSPFVDAVYDLLDKHFDPENPSPIKDTPFAHPDFIRHVVRHGKTDPKLIRSYIKSDNFNSDDVDHFLRKIKSSPIAQKISSGEPENSLSASFRTANPKHSKLFSILPSLIGEAHKRKFLTQDHIDTIFDLREKLPPNTTASSGLLDAKRTLLRTKHPLITADHIDKYIDGFPSEHASGTDLGAAFEHPSHTREHVDRILSGDFRGARENKRLMTYPAFNIEIAHQAFKHSPHIREDEIVHALSGKDLSDDPNSAGPSFKPSNQHNIAAGKATGLLENPILKPHHISIAINNIDRYKSRYDGRPHSISEPLRHQNLVSHPSFNLDHEHQVLATGNMDLIHNVGSRTKNPDIMHRVIAMHEKKPETDRFGHSRDPKTGEIITKTYHSMIAAVMSNPNIDQSHVDAAARHPNLDEFEKGYFVDNARERLRIREKVSAVQPRSRKIPTYHNTTQVLASGARTRITNPPRLRVGTYGTPEYKMRMPRRFDEGFLSFMGFILKS